MLDAGGEAQAPQLEGEALEAVNHRGGHVQIIAGAGSGKTEVVAQRVAALIAEGEDPAKIVAFTFTEKAASELKERIRLRVKAKLGVAATDQLGKLFVGTIHAFCFQLLQTYVPVYETYTPLDSPQLVNFLYRESNQLGLKQFDAQRKTFRAVANFQRSVDVVENELLDIARVPAGPFRDALIAYYAKLDSYQFMSFGMQIVRAVEALGAADVHGAVTANVRHLIVDEYQDVNPAQERLIQLLAKPHGEADLVVVGDDDQAIYQWRGSDVENIIKFDDRYQGVTSFRLLDNRRSRPDIVNLANVFADSIENRLPKQMGARREANGSAVSIPIGFDNEETETDAIAGTIEILHGQGVPFRDIAILVRGRAAYPQLLDSLSHWGIPVQPGGRTGLFEQLEAATFGATYAWLADIDWAPGRYLKRQKVVLDDLLRAYVDTFMLGAAEVQKLSDHLQQWKAKTREKDFNVSLVGDFYTLLSLLGVPKWDLDDAGQRNRLGTIGRFTKVLADYEMTTRRARRDTTNLGEQVGGEIGGEWFYRNFALILVNYANGNYDTFDGEEDLFADAVALGTVHGAKGLEWPFVFIPSLTSKRFPSDKTGNEQTWLIPRDLFDAARYEGSDADERRLFYVALTRARDWVSLSSHQRVNKNTIQPSPYILECARSAASGGLPPAQPPAGIEVPDLAVTYSDLSAYVKCPRSFLLRKELGFMPPIQEEIGYGNAVHHVMRVLAEATQVRGALPTAREINDLLTRRFYLPFANKPAHKKMQDQARRLIFKYVNEYRSDLLRTWATERPFELYLPGVVVTGRADVIYDEHDGVADNLAIVDYKTAVSGLVEPLQLQVYADAGRREGLTVGAAFIHDMSTAERHIVPIDDLSVASAETSVRVAAESMKQREFGPSPAIDKCRRCDVRKICRSAKLV